MAMWKPGGRADPMRKISEVGVLRDDRKVVFPGVVPELSVGRSLQTEASNMR